MDTADRREWLVTKGLGGSASATACGANTLPYHGLLVATLEPPGRRVLLLSRVDETARGGDEAHELGTSLRQSGATAPQSFRHLASFEAPPMPTWSNRVGGGRLITRLAWQPGRSASAIGHPWQGEASIDPELKLLPDRRGFQDETHGHCHPGRRAAERRTTG